MQVWYETNHNRGNFKYRLVTLLKALPLGLHIGPCMTKPSALSKNMNVASGKAQRQESTFRLRAHSQIYTGDMTDASEVVCCLQDSK